MRFACWITKATDTHSEYVLFIAFPRQQWLRERASVLRYTYTAFLAVSQSMPTDISKSLLNVWMENKKGNGVSVISTSTPKASVGSGNILQTVR
jgi:hypothetical protein